MIQENQIPILKGITVFRTGELIYINKSSEDYQEYMNFLHKHDFLELIYVISGRGKHIVGEAEYELSKGDLFIVNHDVPHGFFPLEEGKDEPVVYNCIFMPQFLDSSLFSKSNFEDITSSFLFKSLFPDSSNALPDLKLSGSKFNEIGDLFSKMYLEYKYMNKGYYDILRAYLIELLIKTFRYMDNNEKKPSMKSSELVNKAILYMKQSYNTDIKLEDIAMKCFISKNYFSKLFKEVTGTNFSDYVQKLRIDETCSLIRNTDMKITEIAMQAGFNDIKFFYKVFKKYTNTTPGEYRKSI